jgi:hypothetical protein
MLGTNAQIFRYMANMFRFRHIYLDALVHDLNRYADEIDPRVMSQSDCLRQVLTGHHNQANLGEFDA